MTYTNQCFTTFGVELRCPGCSPAKRIVRLASQLIAEAYKRYNIAPDRLTLHQDRGVAMTAHCYLDLLAAGVRTRWKSADFARRTSNSGDTLINNCKTARKWSKRGSDCTSELGEYRMKSKIWVLFRNDSLLTLWGHKRPSDFAKDSNEEAMPLRKLCALK